MEVVTGVNGDVLFNAQAYSFQSFNSCFVMSQVPQHRGDRPPKHPTGEPTSPRAAAALELQHLRVHDLLLPRGATAQRTESALAGQ